MLWSNFVAFETFEGGEGELVWGKCFLDRLLQIARRAIISNLNCILNTKSNKVHKLLMELIGMELVETPRLRKTRGKSCGVCKNWF